MRLMLASLALAATVASCAAPKTMPRDQTFQRSGPAGQELRIFTYAQWHKDCTPADPPRISLRTQPSHGSVSLRPDPTNATQVREGWVDCTGKTYPGIAIWYLPAADFHGVDQFDWDVIGLSTLSHDAVVVQVK